MQKVTLQTILRRLTAIDVKLDSLLAAQRKSAATQGSEWVTIEEAARACRYRPWTLRQACASGRLAAIDPNGVRKLSDGSWRIWWGVVESIRDNGLPVVK